MAVNDVVDCFRPFLTESLCGEFLRQTWENFLGGVELPREFDELHESTDWTSVIQDAGTAIHDYVVVARNNVTNGRSQEKAGNGEDRPETPENESLDSEERRFWSDLVGSGINYKAVIVIVASLVDRGSKRTSNLAQRELAIRAAGLYLRLVCLPGANAFEVFNGTLYQASIDVIRVIRNVQDDNEGLRQANKGRCRRNSSVDGSPSKGRHPAGMRKGLKRKQTGGASPEKRKRAALSQLQRELVGDSDNEEGERATTPREAGDGEVRETVDDEPTFSAQELALLVDLLQEFLNDVAFLFDHYNLGSSCEQSLDHTVARLCELLAPPWEQGRLAVAAKEALSVLCKGGRHNSTTEKCLTLITKHCLPAILEYASRTLVVFLCRLAIQESTPDPLFLLVQHLSARVSDRADARTKMAAAVLTLLESMPPMARALTTAWLLRYAVSNRVNNRMFGLEVFGLMLGRPSPSPDDVPDELLEYAGSGCLLGAVLARCSDKASTVRAKALAIVAASLQSVGNAAAAREPGLCSAVLYVFTPAVSAVGRREARERMHLVMAMTPPTKGRPAPVEGGVDRATDQEEAMEVSDELIVASTSEEQNGVPLASTHTPGPDESSNRSNLPDYNSTLEMVHRRARDSKVHVRRTASLVLQCAMELNAGGGAPNDTNVKVLEEHCHDPSLLVRKQALHGLTVVLMAHPTSEALQRAWMKGVLPTIADAESTCQDKCAEMIEEVIFSSLIAPAGTRNPRHAMVWGMLNYCLTEDGFDTWRFLLRGLIFMSQANKIGPNIVPILMSHVETENDAAAWLMLSGLSCCTRIKKPQFVLRYWDTHRHQLSERAATFEFVLRAMGNLAKEFGADDLLAYSKELRQLLLEFTCPSYLIPFVVETLLFLYNAAENKDKSVKRTKVATCDAVLKKCETFLSSVFLSKRSTNEDVDEELVIRHLFTVAEVSLIHPKSVSAKLFLAMKSLIATPADDPDNQLPSQGSAAFFTKRVRNHGLIAVGKLCLQHDAFAKQCLPAFGRELESTDDFVAKTNIVTIMCDMCKRYTTLVDPYFPSIVACLRDESVMLRTTTLGLLTNLLQEDYIKWRGAIFYAFLASLIDNTPELRHQTECSLLYVLAVRHPAMFFQHFMECLFYFNEYEDHKSFNKISSSDDVATFGAGEAPDGHRCCRLTGEAGREKRMFLYRFMLENMSDDHRFQLTVKLCQDVLGGVVEEGIRLSDARGRPCAAACSLVGDTLAVLSCSEIKLSSLRGGGTSAVEEAADEGDLAAAVMATAKKTILTQLVKKNFTETVLPVVISLKHKLEKTLSPLVHELMVYLREMVKDYKNEVRDVLAGDKQLAAEVEYDLKRFEKEQQQQNEANKSSVAPAVSSTPNAGRQVNSAARSPVASASNSTTNNHASNETLKSSPVISDAGFTRINLSTRGERTKNSGISLEAELAVRGHINPRVVLTPVDGAVRPTRLSSRRHSTTENVNGDVSKTCGRHHQNNPVDAEVAVKEEPADPTMPQSPVPAQYPIKVTSSTPVTNVRSRREFLRAVSTPHCPVDDITFREVANSETDRSPDEMSPIPVLKPKRAGKQPRVVLLLPDPATTKEIVAEWGIRPPSERRRSLDTVVAAESEGV